MGRLFLARSSESLHHFVYQYGHNNQELCWDIPKALLWRREHAQLHPVRLHPCGGMMVADLGCPRCHMMNLFHTHSRARIKVFLRTLRDNQLTDTMLCVTPVQSSLR